MPDLTNIRYFSDYIGSFWSRSFSDRGLPEGVALSSVTEILQNYQRFVESLQRLSVFSSKETTLENLRPIVIRKSEFSISPDYLKQGSGAVYGPQPADGKFLEGYVFEYGGFEKRSGQYYMPVDSKVVQIGPTMLNSVVSPSKVLVRDVDYSFSDGIITFKSDPFQDPLIPKRHVHSTTIDAGEEEIVLWATSVESNNNEFADQHGLILKDLSPKSENYLQAIRACVSMTSGGPTLGGMDHLVAALLGLPFIVNPLETVLGISSFGDSTVVATDLGAYVLEAGLQLRPEVTVGAVMEAGHPLSTASQVFDKAARSKWWTTEDVAIMNDSFLSIDLKSAIGFQNESVEVKLGDQKYDDSGKETRSASFHLCGSPDDVSKFWDSVTAAGEAMGYPAGNAIYRHLGVVDGSGDPDFTKTLFINPLQFFAESLFNDDLVVIKVAVSPRASLETFFRGMAFLVRAMPPHLGLMVIFKVRNEEDVFFQRQDDQAVEPETVELVATDALLSGATGNFGDNEKGLWEDTDDAGLALTLCPEALSMDHSPDILLESLFLDSPGDNATSYGGSIRVCQESIESANIPACKL